MRKEERGYEKEAGRRRAVRREFSKDSSSTLEEGLNDAKFHAQSIYKVKKS